jgi:very-short-patch-repair endonuclease
MSRWSFGIAHTVINHHGVLRMARRKLELARQLRRRMTSAEEALWERVRNRKLGGFKIRRQAIVLGFIPDFYCPEVKLIIEVDGSIHLVEEVARRDALRERILRAEGYDVIRFTNNAVLHNTESVCAQLLERLGTLSIRKDGEGRGEV